MSTTRPFKRTLKSAVDLQTMRSISSDQLMAMNADDYQVLRRAATRARLERTPRYVCASCGHPVYAPRESRTGQPYWKHHPGAPGDCVWWTGTPSPVDDVSARQFKGAQESPLHAAIKNMVGELLRGDRLTAPDSVVIDRYLIAEDGKRRPDVRAIYDGVATVFEVQLATTQMPIIVQREDFYDGHSHRLVWLTWKLEPPARGGRLRAAFEDIYYSHNKNLFSIDDETISASRSERAVKVRAHWMRGEDWQSRLVRLNELQWLPSGRAFAIAPEPPWNESFLDRWRSATGDHGTQWPERGGLLADLAAHLAMPGLGPRELEDADTDSLINCLLSIVAGQPIGSRQKNLIELMNTFFGVERRYRFARLVKRFAELADRHDVLQATSVRKKLERALIEPQDDPGSPTGRIALDLFPDVFARRSIGRRSD